MTTSKHIGLDLLGRGLGDFSKGMMSKSSLSIGLGSVLNVASLPKLYNP